MTQALDAMVKAMGNELKRQAAENPDDFAAWGVGPPSNAQLYGSHFDLEKVARAGLEAISADAHVGYRWRRDGFWVTSYASDEIPTDEKQPLYALDNILEEPPK